MTDAPASTQRTDDDDDIGNDAANDLDDARDATSTRHVVDAAITEIVTALPLLAAEHPVFSHYTPSTVATVVGVLPLVADAYFAAVDGDDALTDDVAALLRDYGADRARTGNSLAQFMTFSTGSPTALLDLLVDTIGDALDDGTKLRLLRGARPVLDRILSELITGYVTERANLAAEYEPLTAHVLAAVQAGLALGDRDDAVVYVNEAFALYAGRRDVEVVGSRFTDAFGIEGLDALLDDVDAAPDWRDLVAVDEFGTQRTLRMLARRIDGRLHLIAIDVSDVVAAEAMRREFLRGIMHDVRSPLTLIAGWASALRDGRDGIDEAVRAEALDTIAQASKQVQDLVERLLEVELLQASEVPVDLQRFDAVAAIDACVALCAAGAERRDVLVRGGDDGPVVVHADPQMFARVMTNLLDNAHRYGEGPVSVTVDGDHAAVRIDVADEGSVDGDLVERAFAGRVASAGGLGIGLRAAHLMCTMFGGSLALAAAAPTTFRVTVPRAPAVVD